MKRSAVVATVLLALLSAFVFIATPVVGDKALDIDELHWQGNPLTPCFVDARHCGGHVLGSDENGRDVVARLIVGGSVTICTSALALLIEFAIAFGLALLVRYGGRIMNHVLLAFARGMSALPRVPFALLLAIITFYMLPHGASLNTFEISAWFGVLFWPCAFLAFRARALTVDILRRAISDLMTIVLVSSTIEAFGYGHMPPTPTWGNMLADSGSMEIAWWAGVFPGLCIFVTVLLLDIIRRGLPPAQDVAEKPEAVVVAPAPA